MVGDAEGCGSKVIDYQSIHSKKKERKKERERETDRQTDRQTERKKDNNI